MLTLFFVPIIMVLGFFTADTTNDTGSDPQNEQERVAQKVASYVNSHGGTLKFAAAWIGNMEHESGLIPSRIQGDNLYDESIAMNASVGGYAIGLTVGDV